MRRVCSIRTSFEYPHGNRIEIAHGDRGGVGVTAVHDSLHPHRTQRLGAFREVPRDDKANERISCVDGVLDVVIVGRELTQFEIPGPSEVRQELPACRRPALVPGDERHVVHVQREGIPKQNEKQHGYRDGHAQTSRVAQDVNEFLASDCPNTNGFHAATSFCASSSLSRASMSDTNTSSMEGVIASMRAIPRPASLSRLRISRAPSSAPATMT